MVPPCLQVDDIQEDKDMGQAPESKAKSDIQNVVDAVWLALRSVDQVTGSNGVRNVGYHDTHTVTMENGLAREPACLAGIPQSTLKTLMEPITRALHRIDAKSLLDLQRVPKGSGPQIDSSTFVRPIYDQIRPPVGNIEPSAGRSCVRYLHIDEVSDQYSMGIFVFAPYAKIPLHDHPNMCVLSRVLYGSLERSSLDLARDDGDLDVDDEDHNEPVYTGRINGVNDDTCGQHGKPALRRESSRESSSDSCDPQETSSTSWLNSLWFRRRNSIRQRLPSGSKRAFKNHVDKLQAPDVTVLYPFEGNLHQFVAGPDGAAVLDVLVPPYDHINNRDCTFYHIHDIDSSAFASDSSGWAKSDLAAGKKPCYIVPTGQPEDFHCISGQFGGFGVFD